MPIRIWIISSGSGFMGSEICSQMSKINLFVIDFDEIDQRKADRWKFITGEISKPEKIIKEFKTQEFRVIHEAALKSMSDFHLLPELGEGEISYSVGENRKSIKKMNWFSSTPLLKSIKKNCQNLVNSQ